VEDTRASVTPTAHPPAAGAIIRPKDFIEMAAPIDRTSASRSDAPHGSGFPTTASDPLPHPERRDHAGRVAPPRREPYVRILLCPGPRFNRPTAESFVPTASAQCRASRHVVLDLRDVVAIDVAGLLAIWSLVRVSRAVGGVLRLCNANPAVRRLLAAAGVHQLADVYHTREPAVVIDTD
jgi:anti-anti-sigma factor